MLFLFCFASWLPVISTTRTPVVCWYWHEQADPLARELECLTREQIMLLTSDTFYRDKMEQFNRVFGVNLDDWEEMRKIKSTLKSLLLDIMYGTKDTADILDENKYPRSLYDIYKAVFAYRDSHERSFLSGR